MYMFLYACLYMDVYIHTYIHTYVSSWPLKGEGSCKIEFSGLITSHRRENIGLSINQNYNIKICAFQVAEY